MDHNSSYWIPLAKLTGSETWRHVSNDFIPKIDKRTQVEFEGHKVLVEESQGDTEHAVGFGNSIQRSRFMTVSGESHDVLRRLLEHARALMLKPVEDRVSIYTWDIGWDLQHVQAPRATDTVHIPPGDLEGVVEDARNFLGSSEMNELYSRLGIPQSRVYMFHGLPGTGKTTMAHTLAGKFGLNLCVIEFVKDLTDTQLRRAFKETPEHSIVLFEDLDCLFSARKSSDEALHNVSFAGILNAIDGVVHHKKLLVIITCNDRGVLDRAITRRVDYFLEFKCMERDEAARMFDFFFPGSDKSGRFAAMVTRHRTTANVAQKFLLKHFLKGADRVIEEDFGAFNEDYVKSMGDARHLYG